MHDPVQVYDGSGEREILPYQTLSFDVLLLRGKHVEYLPDLKTGSHGRLNITAPDLDSRTNLHKIERYLEQDAHITGNSIDAGDEILGHAGDNILRHERGGFLIDMISSKIKDGDWIWSLWLEFLPF